MITLGKLSIQGFRSYRKPQALSFHDFEPGLYLLKGENGAGKSSLFDMVHWILFDETSRGLKAGAVRSWGSDKSCFGTLEVDGKKVERSWSPKFLRVDGTDVAQEEFEKQLGISSKTALHSFHFSQFEDFFVDLKPMPRMEIYSEVLGLDLWERKADDASKLAKNITLEIQQLEIDHARFEERAKTLASVDLSKEIKEWKRNQATQTKEIETEQAEAIRLKADLAKKEDKAKAEWRKADLAVVKSGKVLQDVKERTAKVNKEQSQASTDLSSAISEMGKLEKKVVAFDNLAEDECPTCGQPVPLSHRKQHRVHLAFEVTKAKAKVDALNKALLEVKKKARAIEQEIKEADEQKELADQALSKVVLEAKRISYDLESVDKRLRQFKAELKEITAETNPFAKKQEESEAQALTAKKKAAVIKAEALDLRNTEAALTFWQKGFKDIRFQVMRDSLVQLNAEVNESLHDLGLVGWEMRFEVEQETKRGSVKRGFLCSVFSPESAGEGVPWESWSGGESQRLRTAAQLGIANLIAAYTGVSMGVEFWDEPSTWLNAEGIKALLGVLQDRAHRYQRAIFLADHRSLDFPFDGGIEVVKTKKGSEWQT